MSRFVDHIMLIAVICLCYTLLSEAKANVVYDTQKDCSYLATWVESFATVGDPSSQLDIAIDADPGNVGVFVRAYGLSKAFKGTPSERGAKAYRLCTNPVVSM